METNATPRIDVHDNPTGCCPRFNPEGWNDQLLHFERKPFIRAKTRSLMHVPLNMGSVFNKTFDAIMDADAIDEEQAIVLSRDLSPWSAEHLFAVTKNVPDQKNIELTGDYRTRVFEGPYREAGKWVGQFENELEEDGLDPDEIYAFYTTCPKCAKTYGKNYVVMVAKVQHDDI